mgnify:CR=1 FL=1
METARLRAMQERAADKQSELDELRARRYQEAKEREWRQKERAYAERQASMQQELANARTAQQASKLKQKAEMARLEHDEFMRVLDVNRAKEYDELQQVCALACVGYEGWGGGIAGVVVSGPRLPEALKEVGPRRAERVGMRAL